MTAKEVERFLAITDVIRAVPGALEVLSAQAAQIRAQRRAYVKTHWGQQGKRGARLAPVPNAFAGVTELGQLVQINYVTAKGSKELVEFEHRFSRRYPVLTFANDGSGLVILREGSRYTVTRAGIEG